jgi:hypothetical protein
VFHLFNHDVYGFLEVFDEVISPLLAASYAQYPKSLAAQCRLDWMHTAVM